jgi:hypothetical protein
MNLRSQFKPGARLKWSLGPPVAALDQEHRFAERVPEQHGSVRNPREFNSLSEIRTAELRFFFAHSILATKYDCTIQSW